MKVIVLVLVWLMTCLVGVSVATAATAPVYSPKDSTIFNNPRGSRSQQRAIITQLDRSIDAAPKGSTIHMAQYLFDIDSTADRLVAAHKRGVNVRVLIDDGTRTPQIKRVRKALGTDKSKGSFVATCSHSCMSEARSVMHAKFYLFSRAGSSRLVSMVSSANPYSGNTVSSWNNIHTIVGDAKLFDSLKLYFYDMIKDKDNLNYYRTTTSGKYKLYFYPRAPKKGVNTIALLDVLNHVSCSKVASGYGKKGKTVVRLATWGWTMARHDMAKRLWALHNKGCKVEVVLNRGRTTPRILVTLLRRSSKYGVMPVYDAWVDKNRNNMAELYMHHKLLTVNGKWFGQNTKISYTGSQNLTGPGTLVNNDIILRIKDKGVHNAYMKNLNYIRDNYTRRVRQAPVVPSPASDARIDALTDLDSDR
jgi:hypothetical protein